MMQLVFLFVLLFAKIFNRHKSALSFQVIEPALDDHLNRNAQVKDMSVGIYVILISGMARIFQDKIDQIEGPTSSSTSLEIDDLCSPRPMLPTFLSFVADFTFSFCCILNSHASINSSNQPLSLPAITVAITTRIMAPRKGRFDYEVAKRQ